MLLDSSCNEDGWGMLSAWIDSLAACSGNTPRQPVFCFTYSGDLDLDLVIDIYVWLLDLI